YKPKILLGLTATPERMDGKDVLEYFDYRIAAEIRLPEAIERKLLSPFQYFGVTDVINLDSLKWSRGGYDRIELSNVYTLSGEVAKRRADMVIGSINKYVTDLSKVKGLGFCVSIEHAKFMSEFFNKRGIPSLYLIGSSKDEVRDNAKARLIRGEIRFIFVVDIYNEGVDIPEVNTVLFLRPTESLTVFLQQLGRGLRLHEDKECLTVLDFIGQANKRYNFQEKFSALLTNTRKSLANEINEGFVSMPKGCYIRLEPVAKDYILNNIRSYYNTDAGLISLIETFEEDTDKKLSLTSFVDHYHMEIRDIYKRSSFSRLCVRAGVKGDFHEPLETTLTKALPRITLIDSRRWISFLLDVLPRAREIDLDSFTKGEIRMLQMFQFTVWQKTVEESGFSDLKEGLMAICDNPILFQELLAILRYNLDHIDFVDEPVELGFDCPLDLYCRYSRDQILVALDDFNPNVMRQGVKWFREKKLDIFINTLNKSEKNYSETTMYDDYSINEWLFHWQSQSTTSEESPTGQRYINHRKLGSKVLLFVREYERDSIGTLPYTFLGLANYVSHEGSRPMSIIWRLERPIPARFIKKTNKLVVG
ncbi:MAG TPA: DUF3427 domain-containing protein, partial [Clostridia bacterium]|nr:DUF3427 domain-containing protein [Clostridia bacterium]